jgi:protein O-mannosyl-transferase
MTRAYIVPLSGLRDLGRFGRMNDAVMGAGRFEKFAGLLVAVVVIAAYANSFAGVFLMDDGLRILQNPDIRHPMTACLDTTRPLVGLSLWMNLALGGRVADFHLFNLAVHLSAALLLFGLIRRTCRIRGCQATTASAWAAIGAAMWGAHPIQTQSVTYIIQRAESMMGMLFLLVLYCFVRAMSSATPRRWLWASVVACALGMTAKPVMVVAPIVVLLFDRQFIAKSLGELWQRRRAFYLALMSTMGIAIGLILMPNESSSTTGLSEGLLSPSRYLMTECGVIVHYLRLILWPTELCLDYAWPSATGLGSVWWQALVLGGLFMAAVVGVWRRSVAGFGAALFFICLAPSSSVIPVVDVAVEHRLYLPLAGVLVCIGGVIAAVLGRVAAGSRRIAGVVFAAGTVLVCVLVVMTHHRNADYHSVVRMSRDTVEKRPDNFRARSALISALLSAGQFAEGELEAREMVACLERGLVEGGAFAEVGAMNARGYYPVGLNQLGRALLCLEREVEAISCFENAIIALPSLKEAWFNMAVALRATGKNTDALKAVEQALVIDPQYEKALVVRGLLVEEREP